MVTSLLASGRQGPWRNEAKAGSTARASASARRDRGSRRGESTRSSAASPASTRNPKTELHYRDPFTLLVAVVLVGAGDRCLGQPRDARTVPHRRHAGEACRSSARRRSTEKIKTIGLYRSKAKNLIALAKKLVAEHGGKVPETREVLKALPGVGRKTANVVLNIAFGQHTIGIDTHAFRVANRTGLAPGKTPLDVELKLERVVPERYKHNCHHWLILHGRYVCKARKPECWRCVIADICLYKPKTPAP